MHTNSFLNAVVQYRADPCCQILPCFANNYFDVGAFIHCSSRESYLSSYSLSAEPHHAWQELYDS